MTFALPNNRAAASKCPCLMLCNFLEIVTTLFCIRMFSLRLFIFLYICICLSFDFCLFAMRFALDSARVGFYLVGLRLCVSVDVVWLCHYLGFIIQSNALCLQPPCPGASPSPIRNDQVFVMILVPTFSALSLLWLVIMQTLPTRLRCSWREMENIIQNNRK